MSLLNKPPAFSAKEKQQVASNWLLSAELRKRLTVDRRYFRGETLRKMVIDGKLHHEVMAGVFLVTWLSSPEACYRAKRVAVSYRAPYPDTGCLPYAVITLPTQEQLTFFD
jgi:hypothetical protein